MSLVFWITSQLIGKYPKCSVISIHRAASIMFCDIRSKAILKQRGPTWKYSKILLYIITTSATRKQQSHINKKRQTIHQTLLKLKATTLAACSRQEYSLFHTCAVQEMHHREQYKGLQVNGKPNVTLTLKDQYWLQHDISRLITLEQNETLNTRLHASQWWTY
jgi:hypothetical protein